MSLDNLNLRRNLPIIGIIAFSLCSVWSLYQLLIAYAQHDTQLFWFPSVLIELITAWAIYQIVEQARKLMQSRISKQDRRFYALILFIFLIVAIPTLTASVIANTIEFNGNLLLGCLFPIGCIGCAVGLALPAVTSRYESQRQQEAKERQAERKKREMERKVVARREQERRKQEQVIRNQLSRMGKAAETFWQLVDNPLQSHATIAQSLEISRQAVGQHISKLKRAGAIRSNGEGYTILWEIEHDVITQR